MTPKQSPNTFVDFCTNLVVGSRFGLPSKHQVWWDIMFLSALMSMRANLCKGDPSWCRMLTMTLTGGTYVSSLSFVAWVGHFATCFCRTYGFTSFSGHIFTFGTCCTCSCWIGHACSWPIDDSIFIGELALGFLCICVFNSCPCTTWGLYRARTLFRERWIRCQGKPERDKQPRKWMKTAILIFGGILFEKRILLNSRTSPCNKLNVIVWVVIL